MMKIGVIDQNSSPIAVGGRPVEDKGSSVYLGSVLVETWENLDKHQN